MNKPDHTVRSVRSERSERSGRSGGSGPSVPAIVRHGFVAILCLWMLMPLALGGRVAQDAVPYVTAGHLAPSQPGEVYAARNGDLFDLRPEFRQQWCDVAPRGTDCDDVAVAFVAAPPVIPIAVGLAALGDGVGTLAMQFGAAAMLAGGMWLLWQRLAHRTRRAPHLLLATAVLLTPMAMVPIGLGQTSPILFLSVCLGLGVAGRKRSVASAIAWAAACALKVFPAALGLIVLWRKRWAMAFWAAGALVGASVAALLIVQPSVWSDFVRVTLELDANTTTNPYNGALDAFILRLLGSPDSTVASIVARLIGLAGGSAVCWFAMRDTDDDTRWAAGYVALLLVTPLVWWHYNWVVIGALGVVIGSRRRLNDRMLGVLPLAALVSIVPSIPNANGSAWPQVQALLLIAGAVTFCVLARSGRALRPGAA